MQKCQVRYDGDDGVYTVDFTITNAEEWKNTPVLLGAAQLFLHGFCPGEPWCVYWWDGRNWNPYSGRGENRKHKVPANYGNCMALSLHGRANRNSENHPVGWWIKS